MVIHFPIFFKTFTSRNLKAVVRSCSVEEVFQEILPNSDPATLLNKRLWHRCFPVNFAKFLGTLFFTEHLRWVLLEIQGYSLFLVYHVFVLFTYFLYGLTPLFPGDRGLKSILIMFPRLISSFPCISVLC